MDGELGRVFWSEKQDAGDHKGPHPSSTPPPPLRDDACSQVVWVREGDAGGHKGPHPSSTPPPPLRDDVHSQAFSHKDNIKEGTHKYGYTVNLFISRQTLRLPSEAAAAGTRNAYAFFG